MVRPPAPAISGSESIANKHRPTSHRRPNSGSLGSAVQCALPRPLLCLQPGCCPPAPAAPFGPMSNNPPEIPPSPSRCTSPLHSCPNIAPLITRFAPEARLRVNRNLKSKPVRQSPAQATCGDFFAKKDAGRLGVETIIEKP